MTKPRIRASHPNVVSRLKHAERHLRSVIDMIEDARPILHVAQQIQVFESALRNVRQVVLHDRMDHRLDGDHAQVELKAISR